ncbi:hypothetical protein [Nonomuraea dietziae]
MPEGNIMHGEPIKYGKPIERKVTAATAGSYLGLSAVTTNVRGSATFKID